MRKKGSFDIENYSCLYSMVDVYSSEMNDDYLLFVFVMKYVPLPWLYSISMKVLNL